MKVAHLKDELQVVVNSDVYFSKQTSLYSGKSKLISLESLFFVR